MPGVDEHVQCKKFVIWSLVIWKFLRIGNPKNGWCITLNGQYGVTWGSPVLRNTPWTIITVRQSKRNTSVLVLADVVSPCSYCSGCRN